MKDRRFILHYGDMTDATNLVRIIQHVQPDEIYNLAAQSHVQVSFESPEYTADVDGLGTLRILEAIRLLGLEKKTRISLGLQDCLFLGNLDARRDWGHAKDFVRMQWMMLQQDQPEDFVIATGEQHSVREFVEIAAMTLGIGISWSVTGVDETGMVASLEKSVVDTGIKEGQRIIAVDPRYFRPTEVETLLGDPSKARKNWGGLPGSVLKPWCRRWWHRILTLPGGTSCARMPDFPCVRIMNRGDTSGFRVGPR